MAPKSLYESILKQIDPIVALKQDATEEIVIELFNKLIREKKSMKLMNETSPQNIEIIKKYLLNNRVKNINIVALYKYEAPEWLIELVKKQTNLKKTISQSYTTMNKAVEEMFKTLTVQDVGFCVDTLSRDIVKTCLKPQTEVENPTPREDNTYLELSINTGTTQYGIPEITSLFIPTGINASRLTNTMFIHEQHHLIFKNVMNMLDYIESRWKTSGEYMEIELFYNGLKAEICKSENEYIDDTDKEYFSLNYEIHNYFSSDYVINQEHVLNILMKVVSVCNALKYGEEHYKMDKSEYEEFYEEYSEEIHTLIKQKQNNDGIVLYTLNHTYSPHTPAEVKKTHYLLSFKGIYIIVDESQIIKKIQTMDDFMTYLMIPEDYEIIVEKYNYDNTLNHMKNYQSNMVYESYELSEWNDEDDSEALFKDTIYYLLEFL